MALLTFFIFFGVMFILPMYKRFKDDLVSQIEYKMRNLSYSNYEINIRGKYLDNQNIAKLKKIDQKLQRQMNQKFNNPENQINEYTFFIKHNEF